MLNESLIVEDTAPPSVDRQRDHSPAQRRDADRRPYLRAAACKVHRPVAQMSRSRRSLAALGLITLVLICSIVGTDLIFLHNLRENTLATAEANLARLQPHACRECRPLVQIARPRIVQRRRLPRPQRRQRRRFLPTIDLRPGKPMSLLKEKIAGLPQVDAVTMIDAGGKLTNFSRYWPIPDVNISDRDYYKALKADPDLQSFISMPVQNRGSGTWEHLHRAAPIRFKRRPSWGCCSAQCRCNISKTSSARPRLDWTPRFRWSARTACCWRTSHPPIRSASRPRAADSTRSPPAAPSARSAPRGPPRMASRRADASELSRAGRRFADRGERAARLAQHGDAAERDVADQHDRGAGRRLPDGAMVEPARAPRSTPPRRRTRPNPPSSP